MENNFTKARVIIFGDMIIDQYQYFKALRLSPEGPAPVVKAISESQTIGGAGNVAISFANLGFNVQLNYAESSNENSNISNFIKLTASKYNITLNKINSESSTYIPVKKRYYVDGKQFMREDLEEKPVFINNLISDQYLQDCAKKYDLFIVSDYQKGLISSEIMQKIISISNLNNVPLFIDTKNNDFKSIMNSFCLKINQSEFNTLFEKYKLDFKDSIEDISLKINIARKAANITNLILTLGPLGSILANEKEVVNVKPEPVEVVDITGAGDAFLAGLTYAFIKRNINKYLDTNHSFLNTDDLKFANYASGSVISIKGTVPLAKEFIERYQTKLLQKNIVGFTNGCFDLLHLGHLALFKKAKENCDYLIVGLNSDSSIKNIKGVTRPINDQETRYQILRSIKYIDEVRVFDENTPLKLIKEISPDVLIKGEDYLESEIIGSDFVKSYGGKILRIDLVSGKSTSNILKKIKKLYE